MQTVSKSDRLTLAKVEHGRCQQAASVLPPAELNGGRFTAWQVKEGLSAVIGY